MTDTEKNEAVARKLGWTNRGVPGMTFFINPKTDIADKVPDYCHDIKAAWTVVNEIKDTYALDAVFTLVYDTADQEWNCTIGGVCGRGEIAPMAIVMAFLKLGGETCL